MLIFNNREGKQTMSDRTRYLTLALEMTFKCVNNFDQYLDADVPCQKLTEGLEGLYLLLRTRVLFPHTQCSHALRTGHEVRRETLRAFRKNMA